MPKLNLFFNKVCSFYFLRNDHFLPRLLKHLLRNLLVLKMVSRSLYISGKLPTYPSPKLILTLTIYLGQNIGLGEGQVNSFQTIVSLHGRQRALLTYTQPQLCVSFTDSQQTLPLCSRQNIHVNLCRLVLLKLCIAHLLLHVQRTCNKLLSEGNMQQILNNNTVYSFITSTLKSLAISAI